MRLAAQEAAQLLAATSPGPDGVRRVVTVYEGWDANGLKAIASSLAAHGQAAVALVPGICKIATAEQHLSSNANLCMETKHLIITGVVQGVGFRNYVAHKARQFHVTGWVRNRHDGSVEAVVSGSAEAVHAMIERARRGPLHAMVEECSVSDAQGQFTRFDTLPDA